MKSAEIPFASAPLMFDLLLCGCGSTSANRSSVTPAPAPPASPVTPAPAPAPTLVVVPHALEIRHGESWNCSVTDKSTGTAADAAWSVQEGPAGGSITSDGVYTAPAANGVYHVIATLKADASTTFTIPITVGDGLTLSGDPHRGVLGTVRRCYRTDMCSFQAAQNTRFMHSSLTGSIVTTLSRVSLRM